jgi:hypothetical protein
MRVVDGLPSLRRFKIAARIGDTLRRIQGRPGFRIVHFSIQPNHLHLIVEGAGQRTLGLGLRATAIRIARAVNGALGRRRGHVLADRYHSHVLKKPIETRRALVYVLTNFRHHVFERDLYDPCSSARWFRGWTVPPPEQATETPVSDPVTWLLRKGWSRKHGRIPVDARPAS